jgi:transcriptional regulator with XRE-family HTH domain
VARNKPKANSELERLRLNEKGWSMEQLAKAAGVSAQTIRKAERGETISAVSKARISKALGVSTTDLFPDA